MTGEAELLFGEERREALEGDAVAYAVGGQAVNLEELHHREELVTLARRTHTATDGVAGLETIVAYLLGADIDIVGRREIVVVTAAQEAVAVRHHFEHTFGLDDAFGLELIVAAFGRLLGCRGLLRGDLGLRLGRLDGLGLGRGRLWFRHLGRLFCFSNRLDGLLGSVGRLHLFGAATLAFGGLLRSAFRLLRNGLPVRLHNDIGLDQPGRLRLGLRLDSLRGSLVTTEYETAFVVEDLGHLGHGGHLQVADVEVYLGSRLSIGLDNCITGGDCGGFGLAVAVVFAFASGAVMHLGVVHRRLGEQLGFQVLAPARSVVGVGFVGGVWCAGLLVENSVDDILCGHVAGANAHLVGNADNIHEGFRFKF